MPTNIENLSIAAGVAISYLALVRLLRYRRINSITKRLGYNTPESLDDLKLDEAWRVVQQMGKYEFPYVFKTSLEFALFRTYAIPTISSLLASTNQFAHPVNSHRRLADTSILIAEIMSNPLDSTRPTQAVRRMNYLHGRHGDKISNDDLLFTLALFMCQPAKFIDNWEWRETTALEKKACWLYWSNIGQRMGITGIPDSFEAVFAWKEEYEKTHMVPAQSNHDVAEYTTQLLLYFIPKSMQAFARDLILAVMDERLRVAMLYPPPPPYAVKTHRRIIAVRRFYMRYLSLPRIFPFSTTQEAIDKSLPEEQRRYYYSIWGSHPWYIKGSWWNRWGPPGLLSRTMGWEIPADKFHGSKGYSINEIGPKGLEKVGPGHERVKKEGNGVVKDGPNGHAHGENGTAEVVEGGRCPVAFA